MPTPESRRFQLDEEQARYPLQLVQIYLDPIQTEDGEPAPVPEPKSSKAKPAA
jgi:hypothetical protein